MRITSFTPNKFLSLSLKRQHKKASEILRLAKDDGSPMRKLYQQIEQWLGLSPLNFCQDQEVSDRFHWHLSHADICWKEHALFHVRHQDKVSHMPFLPIAIYLDRLRSAFNVGSILRTTEAFRLGSVHFSSNTPFIDNPKVQKASMGTYSQVPCIANSSLHSQPRPWIALETASPSRSLHSFSFPSIFTLILGNEEYGIAGDILRQSDECLEIPLVGAKNSLNVASAFSIVAATIRSQIGENPS